MGKNPLDEAVKQTQKIATLKTQREHQLWEQWKADPTPDNVSPLLAHFNPLLEGKLRQWKAPNVNTAAFQADLKIRAVEAFKTYDPNRGAALKTHLENTLRRAHRYNTHQQNAMYIPEEKAKFIGKIDIATNELGEANGVEPTFQEIADFINDRNNLRRPLTANKVQQIQNARVKDVLSSNFESEASPTAINRDREVIGLLRPTLHPDHQPVFDHLYGLNGKPQISSTNDLAIALNKSPSQISRIRSAILDKFKQYR